MNRDDIIRMAKEAGFNQILATTTGADVWVDDGFYVEKMERFAALVAAAEREKVAAWMHFNDYTTGHGDTTEDLLKELEWQVAEREREALGDIILDYAERDDLSDSDESLLKHLFELIRARGEQEQPR